MPVCREVKLCTLCGGDATLMCQRCFDLYCSIQCQAFDWPKHKQTCIPMPALVPVAHRRQQLSTDVSNINLKFPNNSSSVGYVKPKDDEQQVRRPNAPTVAATAAVKLNPSRPMRPPLVSDNKVQNTSLEIKQTDVQSVVRKDVVAQPKIMPLMDVRVPPPELPKLPPIPQQKVPPPMSSFGLLKANSQKPDLPTKLASEPITKLIKPNDGMPKHWLESFPLDLAAEDPIEILVQYVDVNDQHNGNRVWAMQSSLESECNKLLREINKYCIKNTDQKVLANDINVNDVFAAMYVDGAYYRVEILEILDPDRTQVRVRLIDYGNEENIKTTDLLMPNLLMKNLKAFAFQAEIVDEKKLNFAIGDRMNVKVLSKNDSTKMYQLKVFKETDTVRANPDIIDTAVSQDEGKKKMVGVITILAMPKKDLALVQLATAQMKEMFKLLTKEMPEKCVGNVEFASFKDCTSAEPGDICCLKLLDEWQRVKVVQKYDDNYVLYLLDSGTFEFAAKPKFKECNKMYAKIPATSVVMEIKDILIEEADFYRKYYIACAEMEFHMKEFDEAKKEISCNLIDNRETVATATVRKFSESFEDISIQFWSNIIPSDTEVLITNIIDGQTLHVCPKNKFDIYKDLFQSLRQKLPELKKNPKAGDLVLATNEKGITFRAQIIQILSALLANVVDLDTGTVDDIKFANMVEANDFVRYLPVYRMQIKLADIERSPLEDKVLVAQYLEMAHNDKTNLLLNYDGTHRQGVKLFNAKTKRSIRLEIIEMQKAKEQAKLMCVKPTPPADAVPLAREGTLTKGLRRFMYQDLTTRDVTVGNNIKVVIIDDSAIDDGFLTICEYHEDNIKKYANITNAVNKYGKSQAFGDAYYPIRGEMCIAIFPADNGWYRAVCISDPTEKNPKATLLFVDYCNQDIIDAKNIRKITSDLMMESLAHTMEVSGLKTPVSAEMKENLLKLQDAGFFTAKKIAKNEDGDYVITLPDL